MADLEDVARIALALPATTQSGSSFEVGGKGFAWSYREKVAEKQPRIERPDVLAVRVATLEDKDILLAANPETFFTTPHYNGYPAILVRLPVIETDELAELLTEAWRTRAPRNMLAEFDARRKDG